VEIRVEIKDEEVKSMLGNIINRIGNATTAMNDIGAIIRRSIIKNFQEGGHPEKWKRLSAATIWKGIRREDFTKKGKFKTAARFQSLF